MDDDLRVSSRPGKRPSSDANAPTAPTRQERRRPGREAKHRGVKHTNNHAGTSASDLAPSAADNPARKAGQASRDGKTNFLKVHAPWEVLISYAEKLHLRMPIKKRGRMVPFPTLKVREGDTPTLPGLKDLEECSTELEAEAKPTKLDTLWAKLWTPFPYDKKLIPDEKQFFTAEFVCQREPMYLMQYKETFFSQAIRSRIAWEVLMRTAYEDKESQRGIHKLLNDDVYLQAYPLHDGPIGTGTFDPLKEVPTERRLLYSEWAHPAAWYKQQPLGLIRRYFGEKTGLYFAWLGFYTTMLFLPAAVGLLTTLVGVLGMTTNTPATEVCDRSIAGDFIMCPACNKTCPYEYLYNKCTNSRAILLFLFFDLSTVDRRSDVRRQH
ncbi:anoctamin-6-like [Dermacentor variabilis]|uniref:anoctamin-6-like n=1 Tax=Dermacentor variabilis TaxID=34621 RepID=UPI003F5B3E6E